MNLIDLDYLNEVIKHKAITKSEAIIDLFETYLCSIGATVPNKERDEAEKDDPYETYSLIFGSHYDQLKDALDQII